jgi:hypothetical protein
MPLRCHDGGCCALEVLSSVPASFTGTFFARFVRGSRRRGVMAAPRETQEAAELKKERACVGGGGRLVHTLALCVGCVGWAFISQPARPR